MATFLHLSDDHACLNNTSEEKFEGHIPFKLLTGLYPLLKLYFHNHFKSASIS